MKAINLKETMWKRVAALVLATVVMAVLIPVNGLKAFAAGFNKVEMSNPTYYASGCLKSLNVLVQADGVYAEAYGKIGIHTSASPYNWNNRYTYSGSEWPASINDSTLIGISSEEFLWSDGNEYKVTVSFADGAIPCNKDGEYTVHLWTRAPSYGVYTDATFDKLKTTSDGSLSFGEQKILLQGGEDTPSVSKSFSFGYAADCQRNPAYPSKGQKFEASGFGNPLNGDHTFADKMDGNWTLISKGMYTGKESDYPGNYGLADVISEAAYVYGISQTEVEVYELKESGNHIAYGVVCGVFDNSALYIGDTWSGGGGYVLSNLDLNSENSINGTITQDVKTGIDEIPVTLAIPESPGAPENLIGVKPNVIGGNDGRITGVEETMEYSTDGGQTWINVTGNEITGLSAGDVLVRIKETDRAKAGEAATVTVPEGTEKAEGPAAPDNLEGEKPYLIQGNDGRITGVEETMEYSTDGGQTWTDVTGNEITGLSAGDVLVRIKETDIVKAGEAATVTVPEGTEKAEGPAAPDELTGVKPDIKGGNNGKIVGVDESMEYSTDGGMTWTDVTGNEITGLSSGDVLVRIKETDIVKAGEATTITIPEGTKKASSDKKSAKNKEKNGFKAPVTGDDSNVTVWIVMMVVAFAVMVMTLGIRKKNIR